MRILYGIQGTGNGHISRSTCIIQALKDNGARINVIFSGCESDKVYDTSVIDHVSFFKGFTFSIEKGRIRYLDTALNLSPVRFIKDVWAYDASEFDLVITDFEPVSAMIAKKNRIPCIGIGHQYAFSYNIPMDRSNLFARMIMGIFAPANTAIGLHWHHFDQPILPPVIPDKVKPSKDLREDLILVYLPFEHPDDIRAALNPFPDYSFVVYAGDTHLKPTIENNITWYPFSKTRFYDDLSQCSGVICNAGFELPSEALFLGKKLLVKPLIKQFEQESNARAVQELGIGKTMMTLDKQIIKNWLTLPSGRPKNYPDVADHISRWILTKNWSDPTGLVHACWQ